MKNFTPAEEQREIEKLARMICQALHAEFSPDTLVAQGEPARVPGGHAVDLRWAMPLWAQFQGAAKMVFDYHRREEELASLENATTDEV